MAVSFVETPEEPTVCDWEEGWAVLSWGELVDTGLGSRDLAAASACDYAQHVGASPALTIAYIEPCLAECEGWTHTTTRGETDTCPYCDGQTFVVTEETKAT